MKKLAVVIMAGCLVAFGATAQPGQGPGDRKLWLQYLDKIAKPVLSNLAAGSLKEKMPLKLSDRTDNRRSARR